jgi:hypothetical protein
MHIRVAKLTIGANGIGDADNLTSRIDADLVGPYSIAPGFVGYFNVKDDASTAYSVRVFADQATLDSANQALSGTQGAIVNDFDLTVDAIVGNDVTAGAAYALTTA